MAAVREMVNRTQLEHWHGQARGNSRVAAEMIEEIAQMAQRIETLEEAVRMLAKVINELVEDQAAPSL